MQVQNAIDLTAVITTPENIQFAYRIAGPFRRLPALLLDFAIRGGVLFLFAFLFSLLGIALPFSGGMITLLVLLLYFSLDWFYGLFFESAWNGQTPGKWLTKIRVISVDGRPINAYQATVRNFLRLADFAPMVSLNVLFDGAPPIQLIPTFLVALISMSLTARFQRVGDLAAGTMVVVNEASWVPYNIKLEDPRVASLSDFIPASFRMSSTLAKAIALYAERRDRISVGRRNELASHLAKPLFDLFEFRGDTSADLLLCALYYREFVSKEAFVRENRFAPPPPANLRPAQSAEVPLAASTPTVVSNDTLPPILQPLPSRSHP